VFLPPIVGAYLRIRGTLIGLALVATGIATVAWWGLRLRGVPRPPRNLVFRRRH
jgi:hypothetical protein